MIKRYYYHEIEECELIGFDHLDEIHYKTKDKTILWGKIVNGRKSGEWVHVSHFFEGFDRASDGIWLLNPGYHAYYYPDSIIVYGFWGSEVKYDLITGQKSGYLCNGFTERKYFVCKDQVCEFIDDDSKPGEWIWYQLDGAFWDIEKLHKITTVELSD